MKKFIFLILALAFGLVDEQAKADFTFGTPKNLGPTVNSAANDVFSTMSSNGLELYFMDVYGLRPGGLGGWDIWVTKRPSTSESWEIPVNLGPPINSESDDAKPSISADGLILYFGSNRPGGYGGFDLWMSARSTITDDWGAPVNLGQTVNSEADEAFPCVSPDGLELYFAEWDVFRPGGYGGGDIWLATRATADAPWGKPVNLGEAVDSPYYDSCPYLSPDGLLLFFHGYQPGGPGNEDIWVSTRSSTSDAWSSAMPLPTPINSTGNEGGAGISADGLTFYFVSDRAGGEGNFDMWQASIIPVINFNGDEIVDIQDLLRLIESWGKDDLSVDMGPMSWGDGKVDANDLEVLMSYWHQEILPSELTAYWKLDETEGSVAQNSVSDNEGTLHGEPLWQPAAGKKGGALQFDGIDDYVTADFVLNPSLGPCSVFAWIKGGVPGQVIISQTDGVGTGSICLGADASNGKLMTGLVPIQVGRYIPQPLVSESIIINDQWNHVGFVWDGAYRSLYVDGTEVAKDTSTQNPLKSATGGLYIGSGKDMEPETYWSGLIDDVRIYDKALSAEEIAALAQ